MYRGKKIIILSGKIGSGKSYLLNILKENTKTLCIDCDKEINKIMPKKDRQEILKHAGLAYLEGILYPILRNKVLDDIEKTSYYVAAIEGIKAKQAFHDIMDIEIVFDVKESIRRKRTLGRGDSLKKFNYFNKIQKEV